MKPVLLVGALGLFAFQQSGLAQSNQSLPDPDACRRVAGFFSGGSGHVWATLDAEAGVTSCDSAVARLGDDTSLLLVRSLAKQQGDFLPLLGERVSAEDPSSVAYLGVLLENGVLDAELDPRELYLEASELGSADAAIRLGWIYEREKDYERAFSAYRAAANQGSYLGYAAVGLAYERGIGVRRSFETAADWYYKSAMVGDEWSLIRLAAMAKAELPDLPRSDWDARVSGFVTSYRSDSATLDSILRECVGYRVDLAATNERIRRNAGLSPSNRDRLLAAVDELSTGVGDLERGLQIFNDVASGDENAVVHLYEFYLLADMPTKALDLLASILRTRPELRDAFSRLTTAYDLFARTTSAYSCKLISASGPSSERLQLLFDDGARFLYPILLCLSLSTDGSALTSERQKALINAGASYGDPLTSAYAATIAINAIKDGVSLEERTAVASAYRAFLDSALKGRLDSQWNLAVYQRMQHNVERSEFEHFRWKHLASRQGDALATLSLGEQYLERDLQTAIETLRPLANRDNARARFLLGKALVDNGQSTAEGMYQLARALLRLTDEEREQAMNSMVKAAGVDLTTATDAESASKRVIQMLTDSLTTYYESTAATLDADQFSTNNLTEYVDSLDDLTYIAANLNRRADAARHQILAAELRALHFDTELRSTIPYFRTLGRSCVYGNTSRMLHQLGALEESLYFAIRSVNLLQEAREYIEPLPAELRECFLRIHEDRYRWLADLFVEMDRLGEAERVLAMLDDFRASEFVRDDQARGIEIRISQSELSEELSNRTAVAVDEALSIATRRAELAKIRAESPEVVQETEWAAVNRLYDSALQQFKTEVTDVAYALGRTNALPVFDITKDPRLAVSRALDDQLRQSSRFSLTAAALLTFVLPERTTVLLVTPNGRAVHRWSIPATELNSLVAEFRNALQNAPEQANTIGKVLYDNLLGPFAPGLEREGVNVLLVSLDRALSYIPLGALHSGERYLVQDFAIGLLSPDAALVESDAQSSKWTGAAFGVSTFDGLEPLPFVEQELRAVVRRGTEADGALPGERWLNTQFTRTAIDTALATDADVLHFATHFIVGQTETRSYLVLGDGQLLTLDDMGNSFNFERVSMLVLSACNTGLPISTDSESRIESAARRLQQLARTRAVIGTLWPVVDASTATFMQMLYKEFGRGDVSNIVALAETQRAFIAGRGSVEWSSPKYWAPFVLAGSPFH